MKALALALRTLMREWRSGELGVLVLAIVVAVAALTGVGFLVDRIGIDPSRARVIYYGGDPVRFSPVNAADREAAKGSRR